MSQCCDHSKPSSNRNHDAQSTHVESSSQLPHAVITGGSSGIGLAVAKQLAQQGYHLSLIARNIDLLAQAQQIVSDYRADPDRQQVMIVSADVSDSSAVQQAIHACIEVLGVPHLLVTSAGIAYPGYFMEIPPEMIKQLMDVNYLGTIYAIRAVLPLMQAHGSGHLCLISSGAAFTGIYGYSAYGASKFALRGLAESLRCELKPDGIAVSIVYPPDTDTPQLAEENKIKPPETKAIGGSADVMSADTVAKVIVRGLKKRKFTIAPGLSMKLLNIAHRIAAPLLNRYFDAIVKKTQVKQRSLAVRSDVSAGRPSHGDTSSE